MAITTKTPILSISFNRKWSRFKWGQVKTRGGVHVFPTILISQLTFHCFMLLKRQVLMASPVPASIRIRRLYVMPISSSRLPPWNLHGSTMEEAGVRGTRGRDPPTEVHWTTVLLGQEVSDSKLGQRLPRLDETHLGLDQTHLGHVLVGFKDPGGNLTNTHTHNC